MQGDLGGDNNDYVFVEIPKDAEDPTVNFEKIERYKCVKVGDDQYEWQYEWTLNNSSFTASQWSAINSGITSSKVDEIDELDSTLSSHLNDTDNPHNVTPEQIGAVSQEDLEDGIEVDEITANDITIDGKKPSLEGHTHEIGDVSGLEDRLSEVDSTLSQIESSIQDLEDKTVLHDGELVWTCTPHTYQGKKLSILEETVSDEQVRLTPMLEDEQCGLPKVAPTSQTEIAWTRGVDAIIDISGQKMASNYVLGDYNDKPLQPQLTQWQIDSIDKVDVLEHSVDEIEGKVDGLDNTLSNHLSDDNNPHNVTAEQIGAVSLSELQDGIETEEIEASSLLVDGKKPSLEGHVHEMDEVSGLLDELGQLDSTLSGHLLDTNNPHEVTAQQIGAVTMEELSDGLEVGEIEAGDITIDGKKPSLEGHTHDIQDVTGLEDELGQIDSTLSNHLADTNNPHGVTPEQIGAVSQEDLEDGLEVDEISAGDLTIDGKKPSLEGHKHVVADITDFPEIPVTSVNTKTGDVVLAASDINYNDTTTV